MHETLDYWLKVVSSLAPIAFTVLSATAAVGSFLSARHTAIRVRARLNENLAMVRQNAAELEQLKRDTLETPDGPRRQALLDRLGKSEARIAELQAQLDEADARLARDERWIFLKPTGARKFKTRAGPAMTMRFLLEALVNKELSVGSEVTPRPREATK